MGDNYQTSYICPKVIKECVTLGFYHITENTKRIKIKLIRIWGNHNAYTPLVGT